MFLTTRPASTKMLQIEPNRQPTALWSEGFGSICSINTTVTAWFDVIAAPTRARTGPPSRTSLHKFFHPTDSTTLTRSASTVPTPFDDGVIDLSLRDLLLPDPLAMISHSRNDVALQRLPATGVFDPTSPKPAWSRNSILETAATTHTRAMHSTRTSKRALQAND